MGGAAGNSEAAEDAERFAFAPEIVEQLRGGNTESGLEVWPENWPIVQAFAAISTQWRTAPLGLGGYRYLGLDYTGAQAGLQLAGITLSKDEWKDLRTMERAATKHLNGQEG